MAFTLPHGYESYFKEWEEKIGAFTEFFFDRDIYTHVCGGNAALKGLPFAIKDNIALEGVSLSCGSKLLEGFKAPYTATAVQKLLDAGCVPFGKTNLDEFGMGSSTDNSAIKRTNNPWDVTRVAGGSSGGSAAAVAAGLVPFALGSDTGGSVRQPAAFCGVVGLKPTYGAVSRYGLVAYASSLEGIGILADSVSRCRNVFNVICGSDPMDQTSREAPGVLSFTDNGIERKRQNTDHVPASGRRVIGVLSLGEDELEDEVRRGFEKAQANLSALGFILREVKIPSLKYGVPAYYTIATAEASANLARFDSIRYGKRPDCADSPDDLIDKARTAGFGSEVKLRILLGTFVLRSGFQDRYYLRAQRIRTGITCDMEALLGSALPGGSEYSGNHDAAPYDALLLPVFPTRVFDRSGNALSSFAQKAADLYTCLANLAGLPALSLPASVEGGLPVGVQLIGRAFAEDTILNIAEEYEQAHPFPHPEGYRSFWRSNHE